MKVLILTCSTGGGHNAAAYAIEEELYKEGHETVVLDHLSLAGERVSKDVGELYVSTVKTMPVVFGKVYQLGMKISHMVKRSPIYYANGLVSGYLEQYLRRNKFDAIVMPHLFPAETITYLKRKGVKIPLTLFVATDYTCIPFTEETNCDYYILPHKELLQEYVKRGLSKEKLICLGIPVSEKFGRNICRIEARRRLQLNVSEKLYLIAGGSMGAGNVTRLAAEIHKNCNRRDGIVIICGNNHALYNRLKKCYENNHRIRVVAHTDRMALYMKASNVIFTKPGGLTSTEAVVARIPIIHTKPIPGCGSMNRDFFVSHGMSVSPSTVKKQVKKGVELATGIDQRNRMIKAQQRHGNANAAKDIVHFIYRNHFIPRTYNQ